MQADVSADPGELIYLGDPGSEDLDAPTRLGGERVELSELDGRLWKTAFLRGEGHTDVGGNIVFTREGNRLASVTNRLGERITGACIIDSDGKVYTVGEIAPGSSADIPTDAEYTIYLDRSYGNAEETTARALEDSLNTSKEVARVIAGLYSGLHDDQHKMPFLLAMVEREEEDLGPFSSDIDARVLRVVPSVPFTSLLMNPPTSSPPPSVQAPMVMP